MNMIDQLKSLFASAGENLDKEALQEFAEKARAMAEEFAQDIREKATDALNSEEVQEFLEKAKDTANDLKDKAMDAAEKFQNKPGSQA
ncbi:MAG: hypothetical protein SPI77_02680 [Corynebacterium sp.]|nr:hypothetical protein [Corynebacterium sp.]